ncbi:MULTISPECIES: KUP/HAK/KT family potassium transporter [Olivibacter]|uniref:Probable potassium transport system protein Kup n=2 Tax=Olivibacter TaxID=376469 RepID=A0ABV6HNV4_9SPHI|nr:MULTISPECIES: KUP/HAK/KT family potassium transporter [Olivibacter]MCL4640324.1 KUP/HAK/KT family potassium transporter [Olivibacter sp. UJ_SKK_5.1]MDM8175645.1 KUP/HAK/KT family potassium transporter [Olivibacter sp. 47]MDX3914253.1 KUP/HAK/KT family potassium transporter [Pseudosphingobacterium sp.]QEL02385.1 KUP/HAK/KT family potassium transporter [Olivibacter sp. LS-1]
MEKSKDLHKLSAAGLLVSLGVIYGDIGTSPLYVFKAIIGDDVITSELIYGGLSCIFWTLTLQTTIKYVIITLKADNKGEGGILSLFSLVKRRAKWLIFPAMVGAAAMLADGMITPPITVSSAIEGLKIYNKDLPTVPIVIGIISVLFVIQRFGTSVVGRVFGPLMFVWFTMMGVLGLRYLVDMPEIIAAINPYYAIKLLINYPNAWLILGAVFLCTTGAEALYSDLGHCGRANVRISWIYVKTCLLMNYFGQGIWLAQHQGAYLNDQNPFYLLMPEWFLTIGITIATIAAIIASQAMISGSFTLIAEAVRLNIWPKVKINYPSNQKGQLYVPSVNLLLWIGCMVVILIFKESRNMEAAYGLAINTTFLATTVLMVAYLFKKHTPRYLIALFFIIYMGIELAFLAANGAKIAHGGWLTLLLASVLFAVMLCWWWARKIKNNFVRYVDIEDYYPILSELTEDETVPRYASQLVYLTSANFRSEIESKIVYSILQKKPKRADVYWLVHVDVTDEPYTNEYKVDHLVKGKLIRIDFRLGFRVEQRISLLFRKVVEELVKNQEVEITSRYKTLKKYNMVGDFRFVVLEKVVSRSNNLGFMERIVMDAYNLLRHFSLSEERGFGLDSSFVTIERVPLVISGTKEINIKRSYWKQ